MTIQVTMYDTQTLLGLYREVEPVSDYFRALGFRSVVNFTDEFIDFQKIKEGRRLAPLVLPTVQGKPVYNEGTELTRLKAAYVKPKDPISPSRMIKRRATESLFTPNAQTPAQRFNAILGDIIRTHRQTIERREEWMAAQALIFGKMTLQADDYPTRVVDFKRDPAHTVTLAGDARWSTIGEANSQANVMKNLNDWIARVRRAKFGGPVNRVTVGVDVIEYMLQDKGVVKQLDLLTRGTNADLNTGLRDGSYVEYIGKLGPNVELWVNGEYYEEDDGTQVNYMPRDGVLLSGPAIDGARCFGAILDDQANFAAQAVFSKMWRQEDPSAVFVMSQSAPLPVPVNPNNTLFAKVL
ncbi:major head protein [Pseudomonas phage PspYZU01]|uniref:Major capsid protein n=1 Tax=Pseudomonas phage PspYZU01 TaxID=1983555 RepID=A0A2U7NBK8_9CAUD|nr:major head protein [Pseudomonas phage PspYZU01]ASD51929.1 minor capsid protein E [Pseudomonas phage PspYZU01]